jgi:hypothetical protein
MKNVFFTSYDGTVWISKSYMKGVIENILKDTRNQEQCKHFAGLLTEFLDTCQYKDITPNISDPDVDYFYCGSCRKGFPVRYTAEMLRTDFRPCSICGAQARLTPKLGGEEIDEKNNTKGS